MMTEYVLQMSVVDVEALAALRLMPGLQVAPEGSAIWLRGIPVAQQLPKELWHLPVLHTYTLDGNHLFLLGAKVPIAKLNDLTWTPIREYLAVIIPVSAISGETKELVQTKLAASSMVHPGDALLTDIKHWKAYADIAPMTRLKRLRYAVSETGAVLIIGAPLPPIPGREYWASGSLLLPCGYDFEIPLCASLLPPVFDATNDSVIFFDTDSSWQKIDKKHFVKTTRSAVRMTQETASL
jgi:hypothetical protein